MQILPASEQDANDLTELTLRSKAHWGYATKQIEDWREDLTISAEYISNQYVYTLVNGQEIRGYYSFKILSKTKIELDNLFIDPDFIEKGLGSLMMLDLLQKAREMKVEVITLDADPHAESFYLKFGFKIVDRLKSSVPGRYLPVMELQL